MDIVLMAFSNEFFHDDDIKWKYFPCYWLFVWEFTDQWWMAQWPVTRSFDIFFYLHLNKRLSKQTWGWWSDMPSRSLWRHCNVQRIASYFLSKFQWKLSPYIQLTISHHWLDAYVVPIHYLNQLEIVDQWSTRIPPPHRRGWHCSKSQGSHFESDIADNR